MYSISSKVHITVHVEVTAGNVGEFITDYLAENGRIIEITRQISVNNSLQFWVLLYQSRESGLPFIYNLLDHVETIGWGNGKYSNQDWGGRFNYANSITNFTWGASVYPRLDYFPRSPVNPCSDQCRVCNNSLCRRRQECLWCQYKYSIPLVNPLVHCWS